VAQRRHVSRSVVRADYAGVGFLLPRQKKQNEYSAREVHKFRSGMRTLSHWRSWDGGHITKRPTHILREVEGVSAYGASIVPRTSDPGVVRSPPFGLRRPLVDLVSMTSLSPTAIWQPKDAEFSVRRPATLEPHTRLPTSKTQEAIASPSKGLATGPR